MDRVFPLWNRRCRLTRILTRSAAMVLSVSSSPRRREHTVPFVNVKVIEGVFTSGQKQEMIAGITDAMVAVEGENLRGVTWVVVEEVRSGDWGIGGQGLGTADIRGLQGRADLAPANG
jgi:4-oxalocrotonate tautomerase